MISTKHLVSDLNDVPREWVFEHYLQLSERLSGQSVKIKSAFNLSEKTPSLVVYLDKNNNYKFKDFSSGYGGDGVQLVMHLYDLKSRVAAFYKITEDYSEYLKNNNYNPILNVKPHSKWKVTDYEIRHWNAYDAKYWTDFNVSSKLLAEHNVHPLKYYTMEKVDEVGLVMTKTNDKLFVYGYFKEDGTLYKIYQPKVPEMKFIKIHNYLQGTEQLQSQKYLIILSSLKDLMSFKSLGIKNIDAIAVDSENSNIPEDVIKSLYNIYSSVIVLFDNDEPGKKAAKKCKTNLGLNFVELNLSKDLADAVKEHGVIKVRDTLFPLIKQAL
jgi:5S rRNA maturation endonuclease (ribonuclease M5)